jgi:hypothetical protein
VTESQLTAFLREAGNRAYRELVEHHLRRSSEGELRDAALGEILLLPAELQPYAMGFIDATNARVAHDRFFWANATCRAALDEFVDAAFDALPIPRSIASKAAMLEDENQALTFQLFQIATLSFAYSASSQRAQRRFMGIRKGIFG